MLRTVLEQYAELLIDELLERYRISFNELEVSALECLESISKEILEATARKERTRLKAACADMAEFNQRYNIPYLVLINEINSLKNRLTTLLIEQNAKEEVFELHKIYADVENLLAREHLSSYMQQLSHANNTRINSIKDLIRKNLVEHYQRHLEWLNELTKTIKNGDTSLTPELDHSLCAFGKWLECEGKAVISNNSKYKYITSIHATLHSLARAIKTQMHKEHLNYNILVSYLEKCEFISLSIGTELALIDNRMLVRDASKDEMTGALNRNALEYIFINQYELALATSGTFVLAMCDLDHFKLINDTYGHLAGDSVLKEFVRVVKHTLRDSDIIIRYGGEEFIILLPNANMANAEQKLDHVRDTFANLCCHYEGQYINVSVSIGAIAIVPKHPYTLLDRGIDAFIEEADALLYQAKNGGRNRVVT
ncbi:MAG: sensor domain-containing diguanylate cyclase [Campylobacterales bacterium]|nr:sensor domain-containing diguanylate cyclase [Campylobacterales bacterium]